MRFKNQLVEKGGNLKQNQEEEEFLEDDENPFDNMNTISKDKAQMGESKGGNLFFKNKDNNINGPIKKGTAKFGQLL